MNTLKFNINLQEFRTPGANVFIGRPRGIEVRKSSRIDEYESKSDEIIIKVPGDIVSINPSFLEEFLFNIVKKLGRDGFFAKVHFDCSGPYKIDNDLTEAVDRILRQDTMLL